MSLDISFHYRNIQGSRHQTPDTAEERISNLPPRQYGGGPRGRGGRRDNRDRRDERRRTTDDEETVLDSQDVSSVDLVNNTHTGGTGPVAEGNGSNNNRPITNGAKEQKPRSSKPPPSRRSESKHKELVNGTTA